MLYIYSFVIKYTKTDYYLLISKLIILVPAKNVNPLAAPAAIIIIKSIIAHLRLATKNWTNVSLIKLLTKLLLSVVGHTLIHCQVKILSALIMLFLIYSHPPVANTINVHIV